MLVNCPSEAKAMLWLLLFRICAEHWVFCLAEKIDFELFVLGVSVEPPAPRTLLKCWDKWVGNVFTMIEESLRDDSEQLENWDIWTSRALLELRGTCTLLVWFEKLMFRMADSFSCTAGAGRSFTIRTDYRC